MKMPNNYRLFQMLFQQCRISMQLFLAGNQTLQAQDFLILPIYQALQFLLFT